MHLSTLITTLITSEIRVYGASHQAARVWWALLTTPSQLGFRASFCLGFREHHCCHIFLSNVFVSTNCVFFGGFRERNTLDSLLKSHKILSCRN
jgi:hypothetical protein